MRLRPSYIRLYESGELSQRSILLNEMLKRCALCPRGCAVDRASGILGVCRIGPGAAVSASFPHFGEEPQLVGRRGSGTIFMGGCNLRCVFCQNHELSQGNDFDNVDARTLASLMVELARQGCHNINFVSPTHQVPQIVEALPIAIENGLDIPLVYNSGGYESVEVLRLLDGVFDIYMPDLKYSDDAAALRFSAVSGYFRFARAAVLEMHRQVGDLVVDRDGIAASGLIVRHLVLPGGFAGTREVMRFLAEEVSKATFVNIMDQYRPLYRASENSAIGRAITSEEFVSAVDEARSAGLWRIEGASL